MPNSRAELDSLFNSLWMDYTSFNPRAKKIYDLILAKEQQIDPNLKGLINDHVALRTYDLSPIGLDSLGALFTKHGYVKKNKYVFNEKKLVAYHYEHEDRSLPKVFISELETKKFSPLVQETARAAAQSIKESETRTERFLWSRRPWKASHAKYQALLRESEYAAWMYAFGFRSNHFTISVNSLKSFKDLAALNTFVKAEGYDLNQAGGEVKGTPKECLEQSSTLAEKAEVAFDEGNFEIPSCYYEFARRHPMANGELYQGFIAASADKIFESTNVQK